ncbi:MAG: hypothetical protein AB7P33_05025 [Dehalococcoidia bacterium]
MAVKTEWLILADAAEIVAGKLYLMGGGWDALTVPQFPVTKQTGLAASFSIPWDDTNHRHEVEIEMITQDGEQVAKMNVTLEAGRPAGIDIGSEQRVQVAANLPLEFKTPGVFAIVSRIAGREDARVNFRVLGK